MPDDFLPESVFSIPEVLLLCKLLLVLRILHEIQLNQIHQESEKFFLMEALDINRDGKIDYVKQR